MERETQRIAEAVALVVICFVLLITVGAWLSAHGALGVVAAEAGCLLVPTLAYALVRRLPPKSLGLARPPLVATLLAICAGAVTCWILARGIEPLAERVWSTPPGLRRAAEQAVLQQPLALALLTMALLPALAEELLFRGVVWDAWRPRLDTPRLVVYTALAFAICHGSAHRFPSVVFAGLLLGVVRAWSSSLWPAIAFHVANNAGALIALRFGA